MACHSLVIVAILTCGFFGAVLGDLNETWTTHGAYTWVVPPAVQQVTVLAYGAEGGTGAYSGGQGGQGGWVQATVPVTPGETLYLFVGGKGPDAATNGYPGPGYNGGGGGGGAGNTPYPGGSGGGASDVRRGNNTLADRVLVAGGGGGGGSKVSSRVGGNGGNQTGQDGSPANPNTSGSGGTQSAGGVGAVYGGAGAGSLGSGGGGGSQDSNAGGGGGGGGYYGGGGGGCDFSVTTGGGGGGSSYVIPAATDVSYDQGGRTGDGAITLTYFASPATSVTSSQNPTTENQTVTFSIQVAGYNVTGSITLYDGDTTLRSTPLNGAGSAQFTSSSLSVGTHYLWAAYPGDVINRPSNSSLLAQVVNGVSSDGGSDADGSDGNSVDGGDCSRATHWLGALRFYL